MPDKAAILEKLLDDYHIDHGGRAADGGGSKWVLDDCPFNSTHGEGSKVAVGLLSTGVRWFHCFRCGDGIGWKDFKHQIGIPPAGYGVCQYAATRLVLPEGEPFLRNRLKLTDGTYPSKFKTPTPSVVFAYPNGAKRYRFSVASKPRFAKDHKVAKGEMYCIDYLQPVFTGKTYADSRDDLPAAETPKFAIACEGESKTEALLFNLWPAFGIPGAEAVRKAFDPDHPNLKGKIIFAWQDPGDAGVKFVRTLADMCPAGMVRAVNAGFDPSTLWMGNPNRAAFYEAIRAALLAATIVLPSGASRADVPKTADAEAQAAVKGLSYYTTVLASEVKPRRIDWFWPDYFPRGEPIIIGGQPGGSKTPFLYEMIACISSGRDFPFRPSGELAYTDKGTKWVKKPRDPEECILFESEDEIRTQIIPRLTAAGADMNRVHIVEKMFMFYVPGQKETEVATHLAAGLGELKRLLLEFPLTRFVGIDPLGSYLGGRDQNKDKDMRPLLQELMNLCREKNLTILYIVHLNKNAERNAIDRVSGAGALIQVPRVGYLISKEPEKEEGNSDGLDDPIAAETTSKYSVKLFSRLKNSFASEEDNPTLRYRTVDKILDIEGKPSKCFNIEWLGMDERNSDQIAAGGSKSQKGFEPKVTNDAKRWLTKFLADGPKLASDSKKLEDDSVFGEGVKAGHFFSTIIEAADRLGVEKVKGRDLGAGFAAARSYWRSPSTPPGTPGGRGGLRVVPEQGTEPTNTTLQLSGLGGFCRFTTHDATLDPQGPHKAPNGVQAPGDEKPIF